MYVIYSQSVRSIEISDFFPVGVNVLFGLHPIRSAASPSNALRSSQIIGSGKVPSILQLLFDTISVLCATWLATGDCITKTATLDHNALRGKWTFWFSDQSVTVLKFCIHCANNPPDIGWPMRLGSTVPYSESDQQRVPEFELQAVTYLHPELQYAFVIAVTSPSLSNL